MSKKMVPCELAQETPSSPALSAVPDARTTNREMISNPRAIVKNKKGTLTPEGINQTLETCIGDWTMAMADSLAKPSRRGVAAVSDLLGDTIAMVIDDTRTFATTPTAADAANDPANSCACGSSNDRNDTANGASQCGAS